MVADQPLEAVTLATAVGYPVDEVDRGAARRWPRSTTEQGRGFELRNVGGGWRYYTRDEYAAVVEGFVLDGQQARLTQAALETLAVVAYKQPVSRARVSAIRGVNVDGVMRTLLNRGLVEEAGHDHETGANLYRTTDLLPGADRRHLDRRAARAGAVPARHGRPRGRAGRDGGSGAGEPAPEPAPEPTRGDRTTPRRTAATAPSPTAGPSPHERPSSGLEIDDDGLIRLQKLLAMSGVASRRKCEELMLDGLVEVDGEVVTRLGTKVDPRTAVIRVDGKRLPPVSEKVYLVLNKPRGVVSTMSDPEGRRRSRRPGRRPPGAALPRRPARHRHLRAAAAHQRRRLRPADGAPVVRGGQDLRRRGRGRGLPPHRQRPARGRRRSRTARSPSREARIISVAGRTRRRSRSSSWSSTRAATGSCGGCSTTSATRCAGSPAPRSARSSSAVWPSGEMRDLTLAELGELLDNAQL